MGITFAPRIGHLATITTFAFAMASNAAADELSLMCDGNTPEWALTLDGSQARFTFPAPTDMDIPHVARAENRDWPRSMTLIGDRDSAIVILDVARDGDACVAATHTAQVLTQRGQTPIFLVGCCRGASQ